MSAEPVRFAEFTCGADALAALIDPLICGRATRVYFTDNGRPAVLQLSLEPELLSDGVRGTAFQRSLARFGAELTVVAPRVGADQWRRPATVALGLELQPAVGASLTGPRIVRVGGVDALREACGALEAQSVDYGLAAAGTSTLLFVDALPDAVGNKLRGVGSVTVLNEVWSVSRCRLFVEHGWIHPGARALRTLYGEAAQGEPELLLLCTPAGASHVSVTPGSILDHRAGWDISLPTGTRLPQIAITSSPDEALSRLREGRMAAGVVTVEVRAAQHEKATYRRAQTETLRAELRQTTELLAVLEADMATRPVMLGVRGHDPSQLDALLQMLPRAVRELLSITATDDPGWTLVFQAPGAATPLPNRLPPGWCRFIAHRARLESLPPIFLPEGQALSPGLESLDGPEAERLLRTAELPAGPRALLPGDVGEWTLAVVPDEALRPLGEKSLGDGGPPLRAVVAAALPGDSQLDPAVLHAAFDDYARAVDEVLGNELTTVQRRAERIRQRIDQLQRRVDGQEGWLARLLAADEQTGAYGRELTDRLDALTRLLSTVGAAHTRLQRRAVEAKRAVDALRRELRSSERPDE